MQQPRMGQSTDLHLQAVEGSGCLHHGHRLSKDFAKDLILGKYFHSNSDTYLILHDSALSYSTLLHEVFSKWFLVCKILHGSSKCTGRTTSAHVSI